MEVKQGGTSLIETAEAWRDSWEHLCLMSYVREPESRLSSWDPFKCAPLGACLTPPLHPTAPSVNQLPNAPEKSEGFLT